MTIVLYPSKIRHNRDKGTDVQQGPAQRFLPCVNLFNVSCCLFPSGNFIQPGGILAFSAFLSHQTTTHTWKIQGLLLRALFSPVYVVKSEYLRECSASRVWPYMHQLRIMSLVNSCVGPAPVFCYLTFRSIG